MSHYPLTSLSEEEELFQSSVTEFARNEVAPFVREMDEKGEFRPDLIRKFFELGLMGIEIPEQYGGAGSSFFLSILAVEALSRVDPSAGVICDVQNTLVNNALLRWGTPGQKERYLSKLAEGWVGAYALSEATSGSDAFALAATAGRDGSEWILNGQKLWITNAKEASLFVVFATIGAERGYRGIAAFLVRREQDGVTVGKKEDKLGIRASSTCELLLEGCRVGDDDVLGEVGKGYKIAIETLNEGRIGIGAQMVGLAQGALDQSVGYARERQAFGQPIASFQGVQFTLAKMAAELEAARLLVYNAARLREQRGDFVQAAAMAKYYSSRMAERVASQAVEVFGGYGYTKDYLVEKYFRDAKIGSIYEGTTNMQLATIAKLLLK